MTLRMWSFVLQWSRVGIGAALFLVAARYLSLAEIGLFATAYAPILLTQGLHKAGVAETAILFAHRPARLDALALVSAGLGLVLSIALAGVGWAMGQPMLVLLATVPVIHGLGAVPDGLLRHRLRLRALALRTAICQSVAAGVALWLLAEGAGAWALAGFATLNALLGAALGLWLARWRPRAWPTWRGLKLIWPEFGRIALRDLLSAAQFPLLHLAVASTLGLSAAGAVQIATRLLSLIEALTLSPLRFIALPQLRHSLGAGFDPALRDHLRVTARLSCWVWAGTVATAPTLLKLAIGPAHAQAVAPLVPALAGVGLIAALAMPITQALMATGHTGLVLIRAVVFLGCASLCVAPALMLGPVPAAVAMSLSALITHLWYLRRTRHILHLSRHHAITIVESLLAGGIMAVLLSLLQEKITRLDPLAAMVLNIGLGTIVYAGLIRALALRFGDRAPA